MSEAFLLLRASRLGLVDAAVPLVLAALSLAFALAAYPAGRFSDRLGRHKVVAAGIAFFIAACLVLAVFGGWGRSSRRPCCGGSISPSPRGCWRR